MQEIQNIELGYGGSVSVQYSDGSHYEITLHTDYTPEQRAKRLAEIILARANEEELERLRIDLLKLFEASK
jgi:hypothetical protein